MNVSDSIRQADRSARIAAIDPHSSYIVSAPAGSGKTGLLTQRFLALLATVDEPEECLAITFTRKAAAEMSHRISQALLAAASNNPPSDDYQLATYQLAQVALARSNERNWGLLQSPGRLRVQTIDSFNRYLAAQLALETGLGDLPQPAENPEYDYRTVAIELLENFSERELTAEPIATLMRHTGNQQAIAVELLSKLLAIREQWLLGAYSSGAASQTGTQQARELLSGLARQSLGNVTRQLKPWLDELLSYADGAASRLIEAQQESPITALHGVTQLGTEPEDLPTWRALIALMCTDKMTWRAALTKNQGFPPTAKADKENFQALLKELASEPLRQQLEEIKALPDPHLADHESSIIQAILQLLPMLAALLDVQYKTHNRCDFTHYALHAHRALSELQQLQSGEVSELAMRLDYQLKHILVDEFQDTSQLQYELIASLTAQWCPGDGRTLFLVGDAMQSLYSFRNANVGLFIRAQHYPIGGAHCQPLQLSSNFRSKRAVIDWVNELFADLFPAHSDAGSGAVSYTASLAERGLDQPEGESAVSFTLSADEDKENARLNEAEAVAQTILKLRQTAQSNAAQPSIALLVRSRGQLEKLLPALQKHSISWRATEIEKLSETMVVTDLVSLTRALTSSADRIAWLALLRSPMVGLTLGDLWQLAGDQHHTTPLLKQLMRGSWPELSSDGQRRLGRCATPIVAAWQARGRQPLDRRVESLWQQLGGPQTVASSNDLLNAEVYLEKLSAHIESNQMLDWELLQPTLDKLYAKPHSGHADIEVMTIHKSKGLEFDHVLLPGLDRTGSNDKGDLLVWLEEIDDNNQVQHILAARPSWIEDKDPLYEFILRRRKIKQQHEATRVFYVAATRAAQQLHLFASTTIKDNKDNKQTDGGALLRLAEPAAHAPLALLWQRYRAEFQTLLDCGGQHQTSSFANLQLIHCEKNKTPVTNNASNPYWHRLPLRKLAATQREIVTTTNPIESLSQLDAHNLIARNLGTELHLLLQQLAELEDKSPAVQQRYINNALLSWQRYSVPDHPEKLVTQFTEAVQKISQCNTLQWLLQDHPQAACELKFDYWGSDGKLASAIVDRTFVVDGQRWIIDYKSATPQLNESLEQFITRQTEQYHTQLQRYGQLFRAHESLPQRWLLYFVLLGESVELPSDIG